LIKSTKEHKTTIHGVLTAAITIASTDLVPPSYVIRVGNAVDIRPYANCKLDKTQVGVWVSGVDLDFRAPLPSFWKLACEVKQHLVQGIPNSIKIDGMLDYIPKDKWEESWNRMRTLSPNGRSATIQISNLGVWDLQKNYGDTNVTGCIFSQGFSGVGSYMQICTVTLHGKCTVSLNYSPHLLSRNKAEKYVETIQETLRGALR